MSKMFDKNGNHLSAKEICIIFGKDEILSVTAEEYAELERQIEIGNQEHEKVGELHNRLDQALTELEELKRDIKRFFELSAGYEQWRNVPRVADFPKVVIDKLSEIDKLKQNLEKLVGVKDE